MRAPNITTNVAKLSDIQYLGTMMLTKIDEKDKWVDGKKVDGAVTHVLTVLPEDGGETLQVIVEKDLPKDLKLREDVDFANAVATIKPSYKGEMQGRHLMELTITATAEYVITNPKANNKPAGNDK